MEESAFSRLNIGDDFANITRAKMRDEAKTKETGPMECRTFSAMLIGPRNRQEDAITDGKSVFQADLLTRKNGAFSGNILLAVCDGMGGHDAGEVASIFVCERLARMKWETISVDYMRDSLAGIQEEALSRLPENSGTTVAGLLAGEERMIAFNAGDSRIYQLTEDAIEYVSHDHSLVQEMLDQSIISAQSVNGHPLRNVIELGIGPAFENVWDIRKIHFYEANRQTPSYYLICSDGLTDIMMENDIHDLLMPNPVDNGPRLYNALKQKLLRDNTSFIIAEIR